MGEIVVFPGINRTLEVQLGEIAKPQPQWRWYALKVAPGREFAAERILRDDGFDVFVPIKHTEGKATVTHTRLITGHMVTRKRKTVVARPKLNGYVFIGFDRFDIPWLNVMRFRMIVGVIANNGEPYPFSERDMRRLVLGSSRPVPYINSPHGNKKKRKRPNAQITSGPYQGRSVRVVDFKDEVDIFELFDPHLAQGHRV
jgi:transcription antitermination factor NusG